VRASVWRHHPAGSELIREGTTDDSFYVLASGMAMVTQRGAELNSVRPGECVGEMAYARRDRGPRSATVTTVEPSWAIGLRAHDVDALPERCRSRFNEALLVVMAERLSVLGGRLLAERQEAQ
jgi:CRP-like cAMP-binding protein